ncbi:HAD-IA family hydrolase [Pseudoxanthobacter sp.]|uniref:HAD-IA family hydrolase n=1 Tax=Pseudoxanthobacter sp. TaxID=1925742 RepID=UPI002FE2A4F8
MDLILFDVDGTLVDSRAFIVAAMSDAFAAEGLPPPARAATLGIVGLSLPHAIAALAPGLPPDLQARLVEAYKTRYGTLRLEMTQGEPLYDGAAEALAALAAREDVLLGIATGKSRRGLDHILAGHDLGRHFVTLHTADDAPSKPDPTMVHDALRATGAEAARTVMVGDSNFDMAMARAAGIRGIGVSWGFQSPDILRATGADVVISHFAELEGTLARLLGWPR